ncbi:hypothetical protein EDD16DRAFT_1514569 [Pisolithus croceorrhizus]|nr:hypothetical protein EDD16DRAFT_1514569 [Pisolithus croceorrhizus]
MQVMGSWGFKSDWVFLVQPFFQVPQSQSMHPIKYQYSFQGLVECICILAAGVETEKSFQGHAPDKARDAALVNNRDNKDKNRLSNCGTTRTRTIMITYCDGIAICPRGSAFIPMLCADSPDPQNGTSGSDRSSNMCGGNHTLGFMAVNYTILGDDSCTADAAFRPTILGGQPSPLFETFLSILNRVLRPSTTTDMQRRTSRKPFLHKVQDHNQSTSIYDPATIDVAHQLLPPNSFFGLTLIVLGGSIMVAIVQSWEVLVRDAA